MLHASAVRLVYFFARGF